MMWNLWPMDISMKHKVSFSLVACTTPCSSFTKFTLGTISYGYIEVLCCRAKASHQLYLLTTLHPRDVFTIKLGNSMMFKSPFWGFETRRIVQNLRLVDMSAKCKVKASFIVCTLLLMFRMTCFRDSYSAHLYRVKALLGCYYIGGRFIIIIAVWLKCSLKHLDAWLEEYVVYKLELGVAMGRGFGSVVKG